MTTNIFYLDEDVRTKVLEMFDRSENTAKEDVKIVKEWLKSQPHLPEIMEDIKIENFLIENKFSIERTKRKIDKYYTIRSVIPDYFQNSNPKSDKMQLLMATAFCCVHPVAMDGMYRTFFIKSKIKNQLSLHDLALQCLNIAEIRLYEDCMVGEVAVIDMVNATPGDVKKITPTLVAKMFAAFDVFSLRMKMIYFINSPSYVSVLKTLLKPVLKPKIFERIQIHQDAEILKTIFTKKDLPKDYGGDGPSLKELNELTKRKLEQYQGRFDELDRIRVDENLRPEKLNNDEVLGFYGNFKKLDVD